MENIQKSYSIEWSPDKNLKDFTKLGSDYFLDYPNEDQMNSFLFSKTNSKELLYDSEDSTEISELITNLDIANNNQTQKSYVNQSEEIIQVLIKKKNLENSFDYFLNTKLNKNFKKISLVGKIIVNNNENIKTKTIKGFYQNVNNYTDRSFGI
jgi:hypothetical protein